MLLSIPDFLIETDEPGIFKIAENATDYSVTAVPSTNVTDIQISNSSSAEISR